MTHLGAGLRCRIVTVTDDERHVGGWVGNPDEAQTQLALEAALHAVAGWEIEAEITSVERGIFALYLRGPKGSQRRMWVETFDPLDDKPPSDPDEDIERAYWRYRRRRR